jgi:hypothetical protein
VKGPVLGDRQVAEGASDEKAGDAITGTGTSSNEIPGPTLLEPNGERGRWDLNPRP